ncbi:hypothetical protein [Paludibacterium purpuratum]|uniref:hypothetical protein n=1 Tax=Paludibacterium purpuratum TaxID=1144873 RepID=UPI00105C06A0|nr:hypothetical protein [Paludibacterium purpuratum]
MVVALQKRCCTRAGRYGARVVRVEGGQNLYSNGIFIFNKKLLYHIKMMSHLYKKMSLFSRLFFDYVASTPRLFHGEKSLTGKGGQVRDRIVDIW